MRGASLVCLAAYALHHSSTVLSTVVFTGALFVCLAAYTLNRSGTVLSTVVLPPLSLPSSALDGRQPVCCADDPPSAPSPVTELSTLAPAKFGKR